MLYLTGNSENIIYTNVSVNKELSNPTYLMSLTHQQTLKKWTFIPQNITPQSGSPYNQRYDLFKFNLVDENTPEDLTGGTRAWYFQSPAALVYDDARYKGTGRSYPKLSLWTSALNFFNVIFDWSDTNDRMDDVNDTGFTVTINDILWTGATLVIRQPGGGGLDEGRIAMTTSTSPVPLEDVYKISYTGTSTGGTSMTGTIYVPNGITVSSMEPWKYYGDAFPNYLASYPVTHLNTPNIEVDEIGEFRYAIYEQANPLNLNTSLAYNQLEVGLAYITELFSDVFYDADEVSEVYDPELDYPSPTPTSTPTPTPSLTPSSTPQPTPTPTPSATPPAPSDYYADLYLSAVVDAGGTGITGTVSAATRTFFSTLFTNNLWDKIGAIYPYLGGTADSHKFNAKDPRDLDAAYRITWYGGMSHDSNGIVPNGANAYGNTHFVPTDFSTLSAGTEGFLGCYLRQTGSSQTFTCELGVGLYNTSYTLVAGLPNYGGAPDNVGGIFSDTNIGSGISGLTAGVVLHSRTGTGVNDGVMYSNGNNLGILQYGGAPDQLTAPVTIGALRLLQGSGAPDGDGGGIYSYTDRPQSMTFLGIEGLSASEVTTLTNAINTYQTSLGRAV